MVYKGDIEEINSAYAKYRARSARELIGQPVSAIREQLQFEHESREKALAEAHDENPWYGGTVTVVFGVVYGDVSAKINFEGGKWEFSGSIWGFGAGTAGGVGGGPWATGFYSPGENEEMSFEIISAEFTGGGIQMFWWRHPGQILGSFIGPAGGLGLFGGGGTGKWKRV